mmetsp:Transcript_37187/g.66358  ORF Transcript_37187/g.66358 Transcript_37187/m.66358 type:complete len:654 (-) Transcript_37187:27-1988(-)
MYGSEEEIIDVIDVTTKSTIKVPISKIGLTAATSQLLGAYEHGELNKYRAESAKSSFTLCELYQKYKCERKESCRHVHVHPDYLRIQRNKHFEWMQDKAKQFVLEPGDKVYDVFNATIKEVMPVPKCHLEYTRGLFLSSEERDKKTVGGLSNTSYCGKVPTACLLYLNGSCKWGEHCNQAHITRRYLHNKNREFQQWMNKCKEKFDLLSATDLVMAYHPNLYEVIKIPKSSIVQFTRGLYQGGDKVPSVCLLFQKDKCSCEELCKQIHVNTDWLMKHRKTQSQRGRKQGQQQVKAPGNKRPQPETTSPGNSNGSFNSDSPGCSSISSSHRSVSPITLQATSPATTRQAGFTGAQATAALCDSEPRATISSTLNPAARPFMSAKDPPPYPHAEGPAGAHPHAPPLPPFHPDTFVTFSEAGPGPQDLSGTVQPAARYGFAVPQAPPCGPTRAQAPCGADAPPQGFQGYEPMSLMWSQRCIQKSEAGPATDCELNAFDFDSRNFTQGLLEEMAMDDATRDWSKATGPEPALLGMAQHPRQGVPASPISPDSSTALLNLTTLLSTHQEVELPETIEQIDELRDGLQDHVGHVDRLLQQLAAARDALGVAQVKSGPPVQQLYQHLKESLAAVRKSGHQMEQSVAPVLEQCEALKSRVG